MTENIDRTTINGAGGLEHTLSSDLYTDPASLERERTALFFRTWQYAGHVSQLENTGDYFTFDILGQKLFMIRDGDGEIRCFHNVCKHRAHEMVAGSGSVKLLVCPYHAWTYELDGRLRRAPNQKKVVGFEPSSICLSGVRIENFCGFLFVNLDRDAEPMDVWYPNVREELSAFVPQVGDLKPVLVNEVEERCNWKVAVENYSECYHCALCHPTFVKGVVDPECYNIMPQGYCLRHTTRAANLDRLTYEIDPDANAHATDYSSWFLWPTFSFQVYPGNVLNSYWWKPESVDRTTMYRGWHTVGGVHSDVIAGLAQQDLDTTVAEDITLVESVQRGLSSVGYDRGTLIIDPDFGVNSEHSIRALRDWALEALAHQK